MISFYMALQTGSLYEGFPTHWTQVRPLSRMEPKIMNRDDYLTLKGVLAKLTVRIKVSLYLIIVFTSNN